jgi:hypothetical protein
MEIRSSLARNRSAFKNRFCFAGGVDFREIHTPHFSEGAPEMSEEKRDFPESSSEN